jgi:DNA-binding MarR family transcriptional regulator
MSGDQGMIRRTEAAERVLVLLRMGDAGALGPEAREFGLYGLQVMDRLGMTSGVVHPLLNRLERRGLACSAWVSRDGSSHPRRYYRLTPRGTNLAQQWINDRRANDGTALRDRAADSADQAAGGVPQAAEGRQGPA